MTESIHRSAGPQEPAGYDPAAIERKWQERWEKRGTNHTDLDAGVRPFYALMMFPYPSAEGLHVGNLFAFTGNDIYGRFQRLQGHTVFEPLGFDAFGIHSENFALKVGTHPAHLIPKNIDNFRRQLKRAGLMVDWRHELSTTDPDVLQVDAVGLSAALQARAGVQEARGRQLVPERQDRARQRAGHRRRVRAVRRQGRAALPGAVVLPDHRLRRTAARQPRLAGLVGVDQAGAAQLDRPVRRRRGHVPRAGPGGAGGHDHRRERRRPASTRRQSIDIRVFTTRPDTIFGATYLVLAPEHPLVDALTTDEQRDEVGRVQDGGGEAGSRVAQGDEGEDRRLHGSYAINPATQQPIPIWIADYVLMEYGTGAIMAVPGHDERDFEFATAFDLPIVRVVAANGSHEPRAARRRRSPRRTTCIS